MQQFSVPLFIDDEAKIIGPMNLGQFVIVGTPGAIILLIILITDNLTIGIIATMILGAPSIFIAFGKINGENVAKIITLAIKFLLDKKLFLWGKIGREGLDLKEIKRTVEKEKEIITFKEKSKLKEILWDVQTGRR